MREKLIELMLSFQNKSKSLVPNKNGLADHLLANGVAIQKTGRWYRHDKKKDGDTCYHCSVCERIAPTDGMVWELTTYCPYCGAKMEGR